MKIRNADYPKHPNDIVIHKVELLAGSHEIYERDIWNYYTGIKSKMLPELKGQNLFIGIKLKGILKGREKPLYIRHPYDRKDDYIQINNDEDFQKYLSGRMVEIHVTMKNLCPYWIVDFDATSFVQAKSVTADIYDKIIKHPYVSDTSIRYTGKRGFHVISNLKRPQPINEARDNLKEWLKAEFGDRDDVVIGESPKDSKGALGLTSMKINAGQIALWSLRTNGLCCVEVSRGKLESFDHADATIWKVYKKATGQDMPSGKTERTDNMKKQAKNVATAFLRESGWTSDPMPSRQRYLRERGRKTILEPKEVKEFAQKGDPVEVLENGKWITKPWDPSIKTPVRVDEQVMKSARKYLKK